MVTFIDFLQKGNFCEGCSYLTAFPSNSSFGQVQSIDNLLSKEDLMLIDNQVELINCTILAHQCSLIPSEYEIPIFGLNAITGREKLIKALRLLVALQKMGVNDREISSETKDPDYQVLLNRNFKYRRDRNRSFGWRDLIDWIWVGVSFLFKNRRRKILWLGGKNTKTKLVRILNRKFCFYTLEGLKPPRFELTSQLIRYKIVPKSSISTNENDILENSYNDLVKKLSLIEQNVSLEFIKYAYDISLDSLRTNYSTYKSLISKKWENHFDVIYCEQSVKNLTLLTLRIASKHNIPSFEMLHGVPSQIEVGLTDKVGVFGFRDLSYLEANGVPRDKLVIVGSPRYSIFLNSQRTKPENFRGEYYLMALDPIRFDKSSKSELDLYTQVDIVFEAVKHTPHKLIVKLHPRQLNVDREIISQLINAHRLEGQVKIANGNSDLFKLLKNSIAVLTHNSSVGVEAMLMNIRTIALDFIPGRKIDYEKFGVGIAVNEKDKLRSLLDSTEEFSYDFYANHIEAFIRTREYFCGRDSTETLNLVSSIIDKMSRSR